MTLEGFFMAFRSLKDRAKNKDSAGMHASIAAAIDEIKPILIDPSEKRKEGACLELMIALADHQVYMQQHHPWSSQVSEREILACWMKFFDAVLEICESVFLSRIKVKRNWSEFSRTIYSYTYRALEGNTSQVDDTTAIQIYGLRLLRRMTALGCFVLVPNEGVFDRTMFNDRFEDLLKKEKALAYRIALIDVGWRTCCGDDDKEKRKALRELVESWLDSCKRTREIGRKVVLCVILSAADNESSSDSPLSSLKAQVDCITQLTDPQFAEFQARAIEAYRSMRRQQLSDEIVEKVRSKTDTR